MNLLTLFSVSYSLLVGYQSSAYQMWEQAGYQITQERNQSLVTQFDVDLKFWRFYVGGGVNTPASFGDNLFSPGQYDAKWNDYAYRFGYKGNYFDVGYDYHCIHPVMAYLQDSDIKYKKEGGCTTVFVKFRHELRFK